MPDWFTVLAVAGLAGVPWIRWSKRFTLRTLLIATTVIAAALGLIAYSVKR